MTRSKAKADTPVFAMRALALCQEELTQARKERDEWLAKGQAYIKEDKERERIAKEKQERYRLDILRYNPREW